MDIIPMKHILIARDGSIYWYVGNLLQKYYNETNRYNDLISCETDINRNLLTGWDNKLLAKRDGYWEGFAEFPREKDIIFIYEIINMEEWLEIFHKYEYIKPFMFKKNFTNTKYVKLVYELIDSVPNFEIKN